jgi:hypothetical protein
MCGDSRTQGAVYDVRSRSLNFSNCCGVTGVTRNDSDIKIRFWR